MDPVIIVPAVLITAWAVTRKKTKKPTKKTEPLPALGEEQKTDPLPPPPTDPKPEPVGPYDGPGGQEPFRPGGPGQVGPKTFPGPSGGPKDPEEEDPSPVEIWPGTTRAEIEAHPHVGHGLFISSDCETVYEGASWYDEVFLPKARELVLDYPDAFHHPNAVIYELLVAAPMGEGFFGPFTVTQREHEPTEPTQQCIAAWGEFVYGDFTPLGTYSGWINDPNDESWDYYAWFKGEYPELSEFLGNLAIDLWSEPDLTPIFEADWPEDTSDGDIDFDL